MQLVFCKLENVSFSSQGPDETKPSPVNFHSIQVPGGTLSVLVETGVVDQRDTPVVRWENGNLCWSWKRPRSKWRSQ